MLLRKHNFDCRKFREIFPSSSKCNTWNFFEIHVLFVSYNPRLWKAFFMCVSCIYRGKASEASTCREQQDCSRSEEMTEDFLHRGEKSWWWIRLDSRSGYFDKSRFVRRIGRKRIFAAICVFPWTFPRERHAFAHFVHVNVKCWKKKNNKRCRIHAIYIFLDITDVLYIYIRQRCVRACMRVCMCMFVCIN